MNNKIIRIPLGAFEKYFLLLSAGNAAYATSSLWVLDGPLEFDRIRHTLAKIRPLCPILFSSIEVCRDNPARISAVFDPDRTIDDFMTIHNAWDGTSRDFFRRVLAQPLDPFSDGVFHLHYCAAPETLLGFQTSHIAGDGYTTGYFYKLFAETYHERRKNGLGDHSPPADWPGYRFPADWLRRTFPLEPKPYEKDVKLHVARETRMSCARPDNPDTRPEYEVRVVHRKLEKTEFSAVFERALEYGVSTLHYMAACMGLAIDKSWDEWCRGKDDYFALSIPVDVRAQAGLKNEWGNMIYPVGIPLLKSDLQDLRTAARVVAQRFAIGRKNFVAYMQFVHELMKAQKLAIDPGLILDRGPFLDQDEESLFLQPLPIPGVTEIPLRAHVESIGRTRILESLHQSPIAVRHTFLGKPKIYFAIRWHPTFASRIKDFINIFFSYYLYGDLRHKDDIEWELI